MPPVRGVCVAIDLSKLGGRSGPYQRKARSDRIAELERRMKREKVARVDAQKRVKALESERATHAEAERRM